MLASINPLGERGRSQHFAVTVAAYLAASTAAGAALGGALGGTGAALAGRPGALWAIGALALAGVVVDATARVPGPRRQVDETWLTKYRGWVYGAGFGGQLGLAFTTIVTASAAWVAFACAAVSGSSGAGAAVGGTFGLARALPIFTTARVRHPGQLRDRVRALARLRPVVAVCTTGTQLGAVVYLAVAA